MEVLRSSRGLGQRSEGFARAGVSRRQAGGDVAPASWLGRPRLCGVLCVSLRAVWTQRWPRPSCFCEAVPGGCLPGSGSVSPKSWWAGSGSVALQPGDAASPWRRHLSGRWARPPHGCTLQVQVLGPPKPERPSRVASFLGPEPRLLGRPASQECHRVPRQAVASVLSGLARLVSV